MSRETHSTDQGKMRNQSENTSQAQLDQNKPMHPSKPAQDRPRPMGLGQGGLGQLAGRSWGRLEPRAGRPSYRSADLARGPHHLIQAMCRLLIGPLGRFLEDQLLKDAVLPVAHSYIYMRGGVPNEDTPPSWRSTSTKCNSKPPLWFIVVLAQGEGRGTQEGRRSSALFSILYLYESERLVREKCRGVGSLLPACTSTDAATFFGFSKYQNIRRAMRALQFEQSNANNHRVIRIDKLYAEYFLGLQHCLFQGCYIVFVHWLLILPACLRTELFSLVPSLCSRPSAAPPVGHFLKAAEHYKLQRDLFSIVSV